MKLGPKQEGAPGFCLCHMSKPVSWLVSFILIDVGCECGAVSFKCVL